MLNESGWANHTTSHSDVHVTKRVCDTVYDHSVSMIPVADVCRPIDSLGSGKCSA